MKTGDFLFTSESVSEGHPDKVADAISDAILDAVLTQDPHGRVAIETLCKDETVVIAGEITADASVAYDDVVRRTIRAIGYTDPERRFSADHIRIVELIGQQAPDIARGVGRGIDQGAGDQGLMFGFATRETPELMPLPISLAHAITRALAEARRVGEVAWLRPDAKAQVSVEYAGGRPTTIRSVVCSTQHVSGTPQAEIHAYLQGTLLPRALGSWWQPQIDLHLNPTGDFSVGGPEGDCGVTGRKIIVDT